MKKAGMKHLISRPKYASKTVLVLFNIQVVAYIYIYLYLFKMQGGISYLKHGAIKQNN
jgi:hypothetical protein